MPRKIIVLAHNIRSTFNVGSLLRTCDGLGIDEVVLSGYTPYPMARDDSRLPHIAEKLDQQIHKTALGAESSVKWRHTQNLVYEIKKNKKQGYALIALEQHESSIPLHTMQPPEKIMLLLGEEVGGIGSDLLELCDQMVEIPMQGKKESFNVSVAAALALYHFRFYR